MRTEPVLLAALAAGLLASGPALAADPRAEDAAGAFADLCLSATLGRDDLKMGASAFDAQKMDDAFTTQLNQGRSGGAAWGVKVRRSKAMLLVSQDPTGICAVRVAEADEPDIQAAFARAVEQVASGEGASPMPVETRERKVGGVTMTYRAWSVGTRQKGKVLLAITSSPVLAGMAQHMMTFSRAP